MFKSYKEDIGQLRKVYAIGSRYMGALGVLISLVTCFYAGNIISIVYGSGYAEAALALQLLAFGVVARYLSAGVEATLTAIDRLKEKVVIQSIVVICYIALNVLLIPRFSLYGAAVASVLSELVLLALYLWGAHRYFTGLSLTKDLQLDRLAAAVVPAIIVIWSLRGTFGGYLSIAVGIFAFPFFLRVSRFLPWHYSAGRFSIGDE